MNDGFRMTVDPWRNDASVHKIMILMSDYEGMMR